MTWDITAECVSVIIIIILLVNSSGNNLLTTLRNKIYRGCLYATLLGVSLNILSTVLLRYIDVVPLLLNYLILILYFISTPLMGVAYYLYTLSNVFEDNRKELKVTLLVGCIPALIYALSVLSNPYTQGYFTLDIEQGYQQGPWILMTYIIFYIYVLFSIIVVLLYRRRVERKVMWILAVFPIISGLVILVQLAFPNIILTGCAAMCALLIVYLYLQNKQMYIDALTRLFNQREFTRMVETKLKNQSDFVILVISLRDFKFINDKFGLVIGDKLLVMLCDYLKTIFLSRDLYRYSGDEFAIISDNSKKLHQYVMNIRKRMAQPWSVQGNDYILNYAIASIHCPEVASSLENIIQGLDFTIDAAKKKKGNLYYECSTEMLQTIQRNYQIIDILKQAVQDDSFQVYYQPVYDVKKKCFDKAEALVRLPENKLGFVSPAEFIPIAEETGLIIPLTYCVMRKTCHFINELSRAGVDMDGISVNFSVVQFMQDDLEEKIAEILRDCRVPYSKIKIEITESVLSTNTEVIEHFMYHMSSRGIRFLLDDFGSGYSNFAYMMSLPFHTIKLDKSFIRRLAENKRSEIMILSIVQTFKKLGSSVLSEGIETKEDSDFVIRCGIDFIQGFYYARPMPAQEAKAFIVEHAQDEKNRCG